MKIVFFGLTGIGSAALETLISSPGIEISLVVSKSDGSDRNRDAKNDYYLNKVTELGRQEMKKYTSVQGLADRHQLKYIDIDDQKWPKTKSAIGEIEPDLGIVATFHKIIPDSVISLFQGNIFNLHPSLLPGYRGGSPIQWGVRNGEKEYGITVHRLTQDVDAGPISCQNSIVTIDQTTGEIHFRLCAEVVPLVIADFLSAYSSNQLIEREQSESESSAFPPYKQQDSLMDFSLPTAELLRMIRAGNPFHPAYFMPPKHIILVLDAKNCDHFLGEKELQEFKPSEVVDIIPGQGVYLRTGTGIINLVKAQDILVSTEILDPADIFLRLIEESRVAADSTSGP